MKIVSQIIEIFLLGLIGGSVPGPMLTAVFTEVLNGGFKKSFKVIFRALSAESIIAIAILLVVFSLNIPQLYFQIVSIVGAVFLIWLAINLWRVNKVDGETKEIFTFPKIFICPVLSPAKVPVKPVKSKLRVAPELVATVTVTAPLLASK